MKQAKISCPHCGKSITVRQKVYTRLSEENSEKIFKAADEMFKAMNTASSKIFDPKLWKR
jgi:DNA-directed RNA polymerase subunit RPC12/RpoP